MPIYIGGIMSCFILIVHNPESYAVSFLWFLKVQVVQVNFVHFREVTLGHFSLETRVVSINEHFELQPGEESHHHSEHDGAAEANPSSNSSFSTDVKGRSWGSKGVPVVQELIFIKRLLRRLLLVFHKVNSYIILFE